ncbi:MAG: hypothetical protein ABIR91_05380 [Candidatus Saccharimonadales bacterium]
MMSRSNSYKFATFLAVIGVVISPVVAGGVADTKTSTITATIGSSIGLTTSGAVPISLTPTAGGVVSSASDAVSVSTNNSAGYTLTLSNADAVTNLISSGNTIAAHAGTFTTPTALASNTWGYRVVGAGGFTATAYSAESNAVSSTSTWAGVPALASPQELKSTSTTASNDVTTVWYGVKANTSLASGAYSDTVTYTATTK